MEDETTPSGSWKNFSWAYYRQGNNAFWNILIFIGIIVNILGAIELLHFLNFKIFKYIWTLISVLVCIFLGQILLEQNAKIKEVTCKQMSELNKEADYIQ